MTEHFAAWVQEDPAPEPEFRCNETASAPDGFASWLPPSVMRAQHLEDVAEARTARQEERDRIARAEVAHDAAVASYIAAAAGRGEVVSAVDVVNGTIGRSLQDVLAGSTAEMADRIPKDQRGEKDYELLIDGAMVSRSAPRSDGGSAADYALDRQLRRARQLHDDLTAIRTRNDYEGTLARARAKSEASPYATRNADRTPMIYR